MLGGVIGSVLGGVGVFLLGMALLTEGLQAAAGDRLRTILKTYTKTNLSAATSGAVTTAVVQSSSAVTLATLGFVGAGLLSLQSGLGIVFGANVGTTLTAWLVAGIGLKLSVSSVALPLVGVGALTRLLTRGRRASIGSAVAGFGLIFVGIDLLQQGMVAAQPYVDPTRYATEGVTGTLVMVLVGMVMTVVMQSSSAAVTTTLAAVAAGTISLMQAAGLVIGQNIGTTITAAIGAVGGGAGVRRIALAHLLFNIGTGAVALLLLPVLWQWVGDSVSQREPALVVSGFHSVFNVVGLCLFLPLTNRLASWLERRIPDKGDELTKSLMVGLTASPMVVVEAAMTTTRGVAKAAVAIAQRQLAEHKARPVDAEQLDGIRRAIEATRIRMQDVPSKASSSSVHRQYVETLHALDHLSRLEEALREDHHGQWNAHSVLVEQAETLAKALTELQEKTELSEALEIATTASKATAEVRRRERPVLLELSAKGKLTPSRCEAVLEAMRWVDRLGYHTWRAFLHVSVPAGSTAGEEEIAYDETGA